MWKPWHAGRHSNERAVRTARVAATDLSRRRVERLVVERYVARRNAEPQPRADRTA